MAQKTNKSFSRRLKVTKNGKTLSRTPGKNHFNARERSRKQSGKRGKKNVCDEALMTSKVKQTFLPHENF
jgi:ribosomal protein L35